MEDFSQLCRALQSEHDARSIPFSLRDYARMCLESLADLISEDRPEQFHSAMAHFFAALCEGNELFNNLPVPSRNNLNSVTIGVPPRRLFELLNDFARVINELSLLEMSSKTVRSSLQENGFPYRPNEFFSLLEQFERLDQSFTETAGRREQVVANKQTGGCKGDADQTQEKKPPTNCRASKNDFRKLSFYENARSKSPGIGYSEVANLWNNQFKNEDQTDESMRQAVSRANKFNQWQRDNS